MQWYRNGFHCDSTECNDNLVYEEIASMHDFAKAWSLKEVLDRLEDDKYQPSSGPGKEPIRFKRKFAAETLLGPATIARNINLIRAQLKLMGVIQ